MFKNRFPKILLFVRSGKKTVDPDRPHITTWHMHIACWIAKATNAHSQYVILIAFQYQRCLHETREL